MNKEIEHKYPKNNLVNKLILGSYLDDNKSIKTQKNNKKKVIKEQKYLAYGIFLFFGIFLIHLVYQELSGKLNHLSIFEKVIALSIMLFILTLSAYSTFFPKQRQLIKFHKDFLEYNERKSIFHKAKTNKIFWREITNLRYHTSIMNGLNHNVIIGTISKGIVEINITDLNTNPREFIGLIKARAKNVAQQNL